MVKKFSAPLERTARLLDLVPYINSHQGISLKELSSVFGVSQSQMVNDLTTLWMCGLPGYTPLELMDLDFETGYVTINNAETLSRPRSINFDEGVALLLGLDLLRSSIESDRIDLIEKIELLSSKISQLIKLPSALSADPIVNLAIAAAISEAVQRQMGLEIAYHSLYRDEVSTRSIFPIELIEADGQRYLSSYCYTAQDFRQFRVDRIQSAKVVSLSRDIPVSRKGSATIKSRIKVLSPSRDLAERFKVSKLEFDSEFVFESFSQQWLERSILASGKGAALLSPPEIRKSISELAQSMLDRYKAG
jgi:proteasome accessory factor C